MLEQTKKLYEILSDEELDRTFHADDAIICYFACIIVGKEILLLKKYFLFKI